MCRFNEMTRVATKRSDSKGVKIANLHKEPLKIRTVARPEEQVNDR
jgi:hypothetical protein